MIKNDSFKEEISIGVEVELIRRAAKRTLRGTYPVCAKERFKLFYGASRYDFKHPVIDPYPWPIDFLSGCGHVGWIIIFNGGNMKIKMKIVGLDANTDIVEAIIYNHLKEVSEVSNEKI